ncbi:hypothetical protein C8J56DRAFT_926008 [Mycena floridula]|nr:hypothetical protein C8J56DRAFT_926008 [Mycena floridula]
MDGGAHKLLEAATHRTLHAHNFSRASTQASLVLTDLLSRYLTLLTSTCTKYAEHAGRTRLTPGDVVSSLEELGVSVDELGEYCRTEGSELGRYAIRSFRRVEDMNEFRAHLSNGLRQDHDDAIPLRYERIDEEFEESEDEDLENDDDEAMGAPLSISPPPSPIRKRPRTSEWIPPPHIPDFLPPFPTSEPDSPSAAPSTSHMPPPQVPVPVESVKLERPPSPLPQGGITSAASSDYLQQVPYSESSLSQAPAWHLPSSLPARPEAPKPPLPVPHLDRSLTAAYLYILKNPIPPTPPLSNSSRHKVAMSLLSLTQASSRWDPPDTLYSNATPNEPRVVSIGPTYPVPVGIYPFSDSRKSGDFKFPHMPPRPVIPSGMVPHLVSQQSSRVPELARHVLPAAILNRATRLSNPPALMRSNGTPLTYGNGIQAPWNAGSDANPATPATAKSKDGVNGFLAHKAAVPDARLFATWDYEQKDYKMPLASKSSGRARMGSVHGNSGTISLNNLNGRGRNSSIVNRVP